MLVRRFIDVETTLWRFVGLIRCYVSWLFQCCVSYYTKLVGPHLKLTPFTQSPSVHVSHYFNNKSLWPTFMKINIWPGIRFQIRRRELQISCLSRAFLAKNRHLFRFLGSESYISFHKRKHQSWSDFIKLHHRDLLRKSKSGHVFLVRLMSKVRIQSKFIKCIHPTTTKVWEPA